MHKFKTGDEVISLVTTTNKKTATVVKDQLYTVQATLNCPDCGVQVIWLGEILPTQAQDVSRCRCNCLIPNQRRAYIASKFFVPATLKSNCIEYRLKISEPELNSLKVLEEQLS